MTNMNEDEATCHKAQLEELGLLLEECAEEVAGWTPPANDYTVCGLVRSLVSNLRDKVHHLEEEQARQALDLSLVRQALGEHLLDNRPVHDSINQLVASRNALQADRDGFRETCRERERDLHDILQAVGWYNGDGLKPVAAVAQLVKRHGEVSVARDRAEEKLQDAEHQLSTLKAAQDAQRAAHENVAIELGKVRQQLEEANRTLGNVVDERNVLRQSVTGVAAALKCKPEDVEESASNEVRACAYLRDSNTKLGSLLATERDKVLTLEVELGVKKASAKDTNPDTVEPGRIQQIREVLLLAEMEASDRYRAAVREFLLRDAQTD